MTAQIYLAKFVADAARWEPRNVGVVVLTAEGRAMRFVGERSPGDIDGREIRFTVGAPVDVYRDWVRYWRREVLAKGGDPDRLGPKGPATFYLQAAGEVWAEEHAEPVGDLVDRYFTRLVQPEDLEGVELKAAVEQLLTQTAIVDRPEFRRNLAIAAELTKNEEPETFHFEYGYENGATIVGHRVPLEMDAYVHDALYRYSRLPRGVEPVTFVAGFDANQKKPAVKNLRVHSRVIDVSRDDAESAVLEAFAGGH